MIQAPRGPRAPLDTDMRCDRRTAFVRSYPTGRVVGRVGLELGYRSLSGAWPVLTLVEGCL
jgi:hypothetical protein